MIPSCMMSKCITWVILSAVYPFSLYLSNIAWFSRNLPQNTTVAPDATQAKWTSCRTTTSRIRFPSLIMMHIQNTTLKICTTGLWWLYLNKIYHPRSNQPCLLSNKATLLTLHEKNWMRSISRENQIVELDDNILEVEQKDSFGWFGWSYSLHDLVRQYTQIWVLRRTH